MKQIKDYLNNQKDIYTAMWIQVQQKEELNLAEVKYWLDKVVFISEELNNLKQK